MRFVWQMPCLIPSCTNMVSRVNLLTFVKTAFLFSYLLLVANNASAEKPKKLSTKRIAKITQDGDRFADQGNFLNALKRYTKAYTGVVSNIRGQDFSEVVTPKMYNREDLGKEMKEQFDKEYTEEELLLMDSSFQALGLTPPDLRAKDLMTAMLTEEVAGFYDPDNKRMVMIVDDSEGVKDPNWLGRLLGARPTFDKDEQKTTLAHELTHALQDQLYDLNAMQSGIEDDDDMLLAFSALVEGDATLLMMVESGDVSVQDMDVEAMRATMNLMTFMMPFAGGSTYRKAPPIFQETLGFPYLQGMLFALSVAGKDGWESVHGAYQSPPLSTEQILHPKKYFPGADYDAPQVVTIPKLDPAVGEQWEHLGGNCLGELQTTVWLKRVRGGARAAAGWDGDRYEIFRREDGKLAVAMATIWDSGKDAEEFEKAYSAMRELNPFGSGAVFAEDAERLLLRTGDRVMLVEGFSENVGKAALELLKKSKFEEKSFPNSQRNDGKPESSIDF